VFAELGWSHEVIVCDHNSSDRTAEVAKEAGAQVVFEPVNQIARARNTSSAAGKPSHIVMYLLRNAGDTGSCSRMVVLK
jgi:glycosyltransferase involved in cell wall biosynthesis